MSPITTITIDSSLHKADTLEKHTHLVLTALEHHPPHCSLLTQGKWYSLNFNNCKRDIPFSHLLKTLHSKKQAALFLQLKKNIPASLAKKIFEHYHHVQFEKHITCISPIKELLRHQQIPVTPHDLLFELIDTLYQYNEIEHTRGWRYSEKIYSIKHYTLNDLQHTYESPL